MDNYTVRSFRRNQRWNFVGYPSWPYKSSEILKDFRTLICKLVRIVVETFSFEIFHWSEFKTIIVQRSMAILTTREATLKEGYLFKQSRTVWKLWKARFFILKTTGLFYYKKKSYCTGLALGVISLKDISMQVDEVGDRRRKFCLKINADGKNFSLCCFSEDERNSWMTAILTAVTSYVINHYEGAKTDEISYMTRGKSLSRSKSFDAITGAKLNPPKASTLSTSATDLDRIVLRDAKSTPLPKRKQKAFSHWDFKWRNSYISFDVIWSAREHYIFFI